MKPSTQTPSTANREAGSRPDWVAKSPKGEGRKQKLERIGAAWSREDGGICIRFHGTQVIGEDVYLYPMEETATD